MGLLQRLVSQQTLHKKDLLAVSLLYASCQIVFFGYCRTRIFNRKKLSHCLTLVNAAVMVVLASFYLLGKETIGHSMRFPSPQLHWFTGRDDFSAVVSVCFATANIMDLGLGWVFYREHLDLLTTWMHHIVYIWLMVFLVTGDGGVVVTDTPFAPTFMWALFEEIPTFILSFGTVFPLRRYDRLFGATFFLTRIVYHSYLGVYMYWLGAPYIVIIMFINPLMLHLHWFYNWWTKYPFAHVDSKVDKTK